MENRWGRANEDILNLISHSVYDMEIKIGHTYSCYRVASSDRKEAAGMNETNSKP